MDEGGYWVEWRLAAERGGVKRVAVKRRAVPLFNEHYHG
jgi:hypothetical protein